MCLYPRVIRNKKYVANKKNGGNIPPVKDERVTLVPVGCGNCIECRKQKSREWQIRLLEDIKHNKNGKFVTMTFSDESIRNLAQEIKAEGYVLDNAIATLATRRFLERYRKKYGVSMRHWLVTEIGHNGTENIHMHGIIWTDVDLRTIEKIWGYGIMWIGKEERGRIINYVSDRTVNYIVKYVTKQDEKHKFYKPVILTSGGIGRDYVEGQQAERNKYVANKITNETYRTGTGHKIAMPVYWRNKIYSEEEREQLWLQKLDKQERWVRGERIDISNGEEEYYKTLAWYRKINKQLGYGDDEKNWEREEYERQRRILMQKTRIAKARKKEERLAKKEEKIDPDALARE